MEVSGNWHQKLFDRSVLKQEKYRQIVGFIGNTEGKKCLDIGADNGIISYKLRGNGGDWCSADLDENTVSSIRELVGSNVFKIDGHSTPFPDASFDLIVIVDFLEHVHTDREFALEMKRILKPGGEVVINVPHIKTFSLINRFRNFVGLTDEKHGHVRPGYTISSLANVLGPAFRIKSHRTYSKSFSELIDTLLNLFYGILGKAKSRMTESKKGTVITRAEMENDRRKFAFLSLIYPALWCVSKLDRLLFLQSGYKLILKASRSNDG